ncbi:MAG: O-antigen ligase family protein [Chloroflexi bacterium]|nr:O-antigen ligase family protein [Chloroflexota bacterium]
MINWAGVASAALWIIGLAVILAALSHGHWLGHERGVRFRTVLATPACQMACDLGLALVCSGLFFGADSVLERILWAAFALFYAAFGWVGWQRAARKTKPELPRTSRNEERLGNLVALGSDDPARRAWFAKWVQGAELWLVLAAIPLLLFPGQYSPWALAGIGFLWASRLVTTGHLTARTPVDWPILVLVLMLPVALWASADASVTWPALYRLVAGIALFYAVVNWVSSTRRLAVVAALVVLSGVGVAAMAPFAATTWPAAKLFNAVPILTKLLTRGKPLMGEDINANVLAGGLALVWPVGASLVLARFGGPRHRVVIARLCLTGSLTLMTAILLLTQSRGAFLALGVAVAVMAALRWPLVRFLVPLFCVALILLLWRGGTQQLQQLADVLLSTGTIRSLASREEVWSRAIYMIQDFPYTGIGLGTFDLVQPLLYPFFLSSGEAHHAHNLFLQVAVDLGLPGLIAYLALLIGIVFATWRTWKDCPRPVDGGVGGEGALALGLLGSQTVLVVHGLLDATGWANKLAFLPWFLMGLAAALHSRQRSDLVRGTC